MSKMHLGVPHGQATVPMCGLQSPNVTSEEAAVTCGRCRRLVDGLFAWDDATTERLLLDVLVDRCEVDGTRTALRNLLDYPGAWTALTTGLAPAIKERYREEQEEDEENPFDHDSTPNGCLSDCRACAWELEH